MILNKNKKGIAKRNTLNDANPNPPLLHDGTNINEFIFNPNETLPQENVLISIQAKKVLSEGNIAIISGKPKSRKSVVAHSIIMAATSGNPVLGIECNLQSNTSEVVLIDTEQNKHDLHTSLCRMKSLVNMDLFPSNLRVYSFRQLNAEQIKINIESLLESNTNVRLIVIDGMLDLIYNMNDVIEVKQTIDFIKRLLTNYPVSIVGVLHQSRATNFTIGHLGAFMDRFAQSIIDVTKLEDGSSEIKSNMMRSDSDFKPFSFYWNFNQNNYTVNWMESNEITLNKVSDYSEHQHKEKLSKIFATNDGYLYKDILKIFEREYQKSNYWCKQLTEHLFSLDLIKKTDKHIIKNY
jgi:RecA-family ATPase